MKNLYERLAATEEGTRALAAARLRYEALATIQDGLQESGLTQTELARRLGIRKSAVNQVLHGDGNMRISTLAEYLHALGFEVTLEKVEAGEPRRQIVANRPHSECDDEASREPVAWTQTIAVTHSGASTDSDRDTSDEPLLWESRDSSVIERRLVQVN
ncbi:helix-turn-helix domain-containing protein [Streptomyces mirabilis]|uniref:helix-turn-helix domain-containing protein n=1 Tax=Streptomyces mirabilis TaxID=68239 RepID=UPI002252B777|nr:helix-turn-helix transcriptional regulator [Streptomyces mirabilis]MCX5352004.1 helix-turn-helix domain-containing protein [Streptomyces mirabilis]